MRCGAERGLALLLLVAAPGCRDDAPPDEGSMETTEGDMESNGADDRVTYDNFADGFIRNWCRGCHSSALTGDARSGAPEGVDLGSREEVERWGDRLLERATGPSPTMPPAGGPSPMERELLRQWVNAGMP